MMRIILICLFTMSIQACQPSQSYNISKDMAIQDMNTQLVSLEEDLATLSNELDEVKAVLDDKDLDIEIRKSLRKEILEGEAHRRNLEQWISYIKVQRKQRHSSLIKRKGHPELKKQAEQEVREYFTQKELKPIKKDWKKRYRTAIEL